MLISIYYPTLNCELAIEAGNHHIAVLWLYGAVNDKGIAGAELKVHRVAFRDDQKCGELVLDEPLVKVNGSLDVVIGRRWEPGRNLTAGDDEFYLRACS